MVSRNQTYAACTLLVIDNYDSFTYNLVQMFTAFHLNIVVKRSDAITIAQAEALDPDYILVSPGPKDPAHAGISREIIARFYSIRPILGVCLGMQCMNEVFGGRTVRAPVPVHGKTSHVSHTGQGLFKGMPPSFQAARYHSLMIEPCGDRLVTTAWCDGDVIMGIELAGLPVFGVQFHPESFMTEKGEILIKNFLESGSRSV
ncbi:MAG: aminodeoxychorismate/anthranilate synthase component II [Pseudomonadota bacterium]